MRQSNSSCSHVVLFYLHLKKQKNTKTPYFEGSCFLKVIDVDITKNLVTVHCYDKQHVCAYLQPFSHYVSQ